MPPRFKVEEGRHGAALGWEIDDLIGSGFIIHGVDSSNLNGNRANKGLICLASPHTLRPQFFHCGFMDLDQPGDILVCVGGAHEPMIGRYVQPILAVQQPQASTDESDSPGAHP